MMNKITQKIRERQSQHPAFAARRQSAHGFTLIEMLVALSIFMLLMVIILVPVNMGVDMLHIGKARADVQGATQRAINRMRVDINKAIYIFPNSNIQGVTNNPTNPYRDAPPYYVSSATKIKGTPTGICGGPRSGSLQRLDMLVPRTSNGTILTPIQPATYIVTYYARRRNIDKNYQPIDNPIVLYRAQVPYELGNGEMIDPNGAQTASNPYNADVTKDRYGSGCNDRGSWWLAMSQSGEFNLQPETEGSADPFKKHGSNNALLPVNMGLATDASYKQSSPAYVTPKSTFICQDTNSNGLINRIKVNLVLEKIDSVGAEPKGQQLGYGQVINAPNVHYVSGVR